MRLVSSTSLSVVFFMSRPYFSGRMGCKKSARSVSEKTRVEEAHVGLEQRVREGVRSGH